MLAAIAQSVLRLVTDWTVRGSNAGGREISALVLTGADAHPSSFTVGTSSFPGVKRRERDVDHPSRSSAEVKVRVELYISAPSGCSWLVLGCTLMQFVCI